MSPQGLPTLTIWQPWASLTMIVDPATGEPIKRIETRGWAAPERLIGRYVGIHAAARKPTFGRIGNTLTHNEDIPTLSAAGSDYPLPLGALLGAARLDACIPMVGDDDLRPETGRYLLLDGYGGGSVAPDLVPDVSDQVPYGDFAPGRFAWLLSDAKPTTERCPRCLNQFEGRMPGYVYGSNWEWVPCRTCRGNGYCRGPIPAKGKQRLWYWTPERES